MDFIDLRSWKSAVAALFAGLMSILQHAFGNPFSTEMHGRGLAIVCVLLLLDWALATGMAIASGTWRFSRLRRGASKLAVWGVILLVSHRLQYAIGVPWADVMLDFTGDYLLVYLIWVDLMSVLRHLVALAMLSGVSMPGLPEVIDRVDAWHSGALKRIAPPGCPQPDSCASTCAQCNGKKKGATS